MDLVPSRRELSEMLRGYKQREFEQRNGSTIALILDKIIYQDVGLVLQSIGEAAKAIRPDASVGDRQFAAGEITTRIVTDAASSLKYRMLKRYEFPPSSPYASFNSFTQSPMIFGQWALDVPSIFQLLSDTTSKMIARDAGIFLGILAARYIRSCPLELYDAWVRRENMSRFWSSLLRISTMKGELKMSIYY